MVQLWVNLPAAHKMSEPKYQAIANSDMTNIELSDGAGYIELIAGDYNNHQGPASTFTPLHMSNAKLNEGGKAAYTFPAHYSTAAIVIEGNVKINGEQVPQDHFCLFSRNGEEFEIEAETDTVVLVLSGEPIQEPIAAHGPFVMNTRDELVQAFNDFNDGKFGYLED